MQDPKDNNIPIHILVWDVRIGFICVGIHKNHTLWARRYVRQITHQHNHSCLGGRNRKLGDMKENLVMLWKNSLQLVLEEAARIWIIGHITAFSKETEKILRLGVLPWSHPFFSLQWFYDQMMDEGLWASYSSLSLDIHVRYTCYLWTRVKLVLFCGLISPMQAIIFIFIYFADFTANVFK